MSLASIRDKFLGRKEYRPSLTIQEREEKEKLERFAKKVWRYASDKAGTRYGSGKLAAVFLSLAAELAFLFRMSEDDFAELARTNYRAAERRLKPADRIKVDQIKKEAAN